MGNVRYWLISCHWLILGLLWLPLLANAAALATEDGKLLLRRDSAAEPVRLSGDWRYIADRWVQPDELPTTVATATLRVPSEVRPGDGKRLQQSSGTAMLDLLIESSFVNPPALRFQRLCGAAVIHLFPAGATSAPPLARFGKLSDPHRGEIRFNEIVTLPALAPGAYHLLIQQSTLHPGASALCGPIEFGDAEALAYSSTLGTIKNVTVVALLLGVALGSLLLGSQNGDRAAPWLTLVCLGCALLLTTVSGLLDLLVPPEFVHHLYRFRIVGVYTALAWLPAALLMLFHQTLLIPLPRWLKIANIAIPAALNISFIAATDHFTPYPQLLVGLWVVQLLAGYTVVVVAARRRRDYAYVALVSGLPVLIAMPLDAYRYFQLSTIDIYTPYALAFLVAMHAGIYTMRFGTAYRLAARLSAHLQEEVDARTLELSTKNSKLEQTQVELKQANETLQQLSITDGLTGVHNRMYFEQQLHQEWRRCARQALPLSLLMIDADYFKRLNDSAGHQVGDACLRSVAAEIAQHFKRAGELVARYGGEEFIVLLPDTPQNKALAIAEALRMAVERMPIDYGNTHYRVTISIGVSTVIPGLDQQPTQLIATADAALYEAKDAGRNRVHCIPLMGARSLTAQQQLHL